MIRVRFAPSPTGPIHLGNARTALFNWLFVRHNGGVFILRIEDTDVTRSDPRYTQLIMDDLRWLGMDWQEGPDVGGPYGPYVQSQRLPIYQDSAEKLLEEGKAYPCYCTQSELEERRKAALARGRPPRYDNRCRNLSEAEKKAFEAEGRKPSLRFLVGSGPATIPPGEKLVFEDMIRGKLEFNLSVLGDFVIMKADGTPSFHMAVVVDDALMKVTHVIRGEDHLSNTPLHILLFEALGFPRPRYAHLPMIAGEEGDLLSKRAGALSIQDYRRQGYLPEALVNYMLLLGWSPGQKQEKIAPEKAVEKFDIHHISKSPAHFDPKKLDWLAEKYLRQADPERLIELIVPLLPEGAKRIERTKLKALVEAVRPGLPNLSQVVKESEWFFKEPVLDEDKIVTLSSDKSQIVLTHVLKTLEELGEGFVHVYNNIIQPLAEKGGLAPKEVMMPLRLALTGSTHGPELVAVISLLGHEGCKRRLRKLIAQIGRLNKNEINILKKT
ncbi:MAG: glutamate--tRNA ligase [Candidatus Brocadiaceae bacterium]|nr:glutamate--tRNA ligase [Candidatus Brocadiaceae bacterium]